MFENNKGKEKKKGTLSKVDDDKMNISVPKGFGIFKYESGRTNFFRNSFRKSY